MSFWPIIIALVVLAVAYAMFYMMPEIIDFEMSFIWIAGGFILVYIIAAVYLSFVIPSWQKTTGNSPVQETTVQDRTVNVNTTP